MVTEERPQERWGPRPGEDWRAHRMRVFADYPEHLAVLRVAESREHEVEIWREWKLMRHEGDAEMQALIRESRFDLDAPPEMDEEDIRPTAEERASDDRQQIIDDLLRFLAARYPDRAEEILGAP